MRKMDNKPAAQPLSETRPSPARRVALTGMLSALALVLSYLESLLPPLPMLPPGFKIGLSNLAPMGAAATVSLPCALLIAVVKGGFAFLTRGGAAGLMSLCGGLLSTLVTGLLLRGRCSPFGMAGIGVAGALTHNIAQLLIAVVLTSPAAFGYLPFLLLLALPSGVLTGVLLRYLLALLEKIRKKSGGL